jgi:atypical dual specificity phosphatase
LRRVRAVVTDEPTFFSWVIRGKLAASGLPASRGQLEWLANKGVDSVLTLTEQPLPEASTEGLSMEFKHIAMVDHAPPDVGLLGEAAEYINSQVAGGRTLLVHCLAGKGRTGSALAAYMIAYQGKSAQDAIDSLRQMRPGSVELPQREVVQEFERRLKRSK